MDEPFISIIVASYNYEEFITRNLDSLLNQTYKNYEIIVVDDGSSDSSPQIIKKYALQHKVIRYFEHENHQNKGLAKTIQLALMQAKGDYIAFCEADDYWRKDHLEKKTACIKKFPDADIIVNPVCRFGDLQKIADSKRGFYTLFYKLSRLKKPQNIYFTTINTMVFPTFSCVMVRTSVLKDKKLNLNPAIKDGLDCWLWKQLILFCKVMYINEELTYWFLREGSNAGKSISKEIKETKIDYYKELDRILPLSALQKLQKRIFPLYDKFIWQIRLKNDYLLKRLFQITICKKKVDFDK